MDQKRTLERQEDAISQKNGTSLNLSGRSGNGEGVLRFELQIGPPGTVLDLFLKSH